MRYVKHPELLERTSRVCFVSATKDKYVFALYPPKLEYMWFEKPPPTISMADMRQLLDRGPKKTWYFGRRHLHKTQHGEAVGLVVLCAKLAVEFRLQFCTD